MESSTIKQKIQYGVNKMWISTEKSISIAHFVQTANADSPCRRLHGHTVKVEVKVEGEIQKDGMVVDFRLIKQIINQLDHRTLVPNSLIEHTTILNGEMQYAINTGYSNISLPARDCIALDIPSVTSEYLARYLVGIISKSIKDDDVFVEVRVWEGPNSYAEASSCD